MSVRRKAAHRVIILSLAVSAVTGGVVATYGYQRRAVEQRIVADRERALTLAATGDPTAARALGNYLRDRPADIDALHALAQLRLATPHPTRDALFDARARLQQLLALSPGRADANQMLLDVFERLGYAEELLALANRMLSTMPTDSKALRARAVSLGALDRKTECVTAWRAYLSEKPADVLGHVGLIAAMRRAAVDSDEVVAYGKRVAEAHPTSDAFVLPLARALHDASRDAEALAVLRPLIERPPEEPQVLIELVDLLDRVRAYDAAGRALASATTQASSPLIAAAAIERLWQAGRHAEVIAQTAKRLSDSPRDVAALAFRTMSLLATGQESEARGAFDELKNVASDAAELAWKEALSVEFEVPVLGAAERLGRLRRAVAYDRSNGIALVMLGRALMQSGETDVAANCLASAARLMPAWATPSAELADALLAAGRASEAIVAAKSAYARSPNDPAVLRTLARVRYANLPPGREATAEMAALREYVTQLAKQIGEDETLSAISIGLSARAGDHASVEAQLGTALKTAASPAAFDMLADACERGGLDAITRIFRHAEEAGLASPRLAMRAATRAFGLGDVDSTRRISDRAWSHGQGDARWASVAARLFDMTGDSRAGEAWRRALESTPYDPAIQLAAIVDAQATLGTGAWQSQALDRIRNAVGEDSQTWRIAQAHLLLSSSQDSERKRAANIATDLVREWPMRTDLRLLLATALRASGRAEQAIEQLRIAVDRTPEDAGLHLAYISLQREAGRVDDAETSLLRLASFAQRETRATDAVARELLAIGQSAVAVDFLDRSANQLALAESSRILLANALEMAGDVRRADATLTSLVDDASAPSAEALVQAAMFDRRIGNETRGAARFDRIATASASNVQKASARAKYHAAFGETTLARAAFADGLRLARTDASLVREAIAFELGLGDIDRAHQIALDAIQQSPADPTIASIHREVTDRIRVAQAVDGDDPSRLLAVASLLTASPDRRLEADAIAAWRDAKVSGAMSIRLAQQLTRLSGRFPTAIPLAKAAIDAQFEVKSPTGAIAIARRLASLPNAGVDALALATRTAARTENWQLTNDAGSRWHGAAPKELEAVYLLAKARLSLGRPLEACELLDAAAPTFTPVSHPQAAHLCMQARLACGRIDDAFAVVAPWLTTSREARTMLLATVDASPSFLTGERLDAYVRSIAGLSASALVDDVRTVLNLKDANQTNSLLPSIVGVMAASIVDESADRQATLAYCDALVRLSREGEAESVLRASLNRLADDPDVANALAYLLLNRPTSGDESKRLALHATQRVPSHAGYLDTLARVQLQMGELPLAEETFRRALTFEPTSIDAKLGLAQVMLRMSRRSDAEPLIAELAAIDAAGQTPRHLKTQIDQLLVIFRIASTAN